MKMESTFEVPCPCGRIVSTHERQAVCPACARLLDVTQWGKQPTPEAQR
jgi:endogenous inhibitor of DNA gyrase (YacG/DUF329 family)